jgi:hypothetical protein
MALPVQSGHAADVPIDKAPTAPSVKEARLRALSVRTGRSVESLRRIPEDTLRRLWDSRNDVISHTNEDGSSTTHVRDIDAGRAVEGGPIENAGGTDRGQKSSGTSRDSSGRFISPTKS